MHGKYIHKVDCEISKWIKLKEEVLTRIKVLTENSDDISHKGPEQPRILVA